MSYEPTNWKDGDLVTSAKLNKLEQGVAGTGVLIVGLTIDGSTGILDKTWQEIHDAEFAVIRYETEMDKSTQFITETLYSDGYGYLVNTDSYQFKTDSADGYPAHSLLSDNPVLDAN